MSARDPVPTVIRVIAVMCMAWGEPWWACWLFILAWIYQDWD